MNFSIIVPFYNEEKNVAKLHKEIIRSLERIKNEHKFELIYVDDGSKDKTRRELIKIKKSFFSHKLIFHKKNQSQSKAIQSGTNESIYENLIFLDGDLQNDPSDINKLMSFYIKKKLDR